MSRARKRLRAALAALLGIVLATASLVGWRWATGNVGTVVPGEIYRSRQLSAIELTRIVRDRGIRTVVNLRGPNPDAAWYHEERAAALEAGVTLIDLAMASDYWLTREQAATIIETLDTAERPLLIHCQFGAERTGLVTAIAELLRPGATLESARAQFSPYYLFLPIKDGLVMAGHLRQYEHYLTAIGRRHSPEVFRAWIAGWYLPGTPNRTQWPYDPYPLRVVTEPPRTAHR